MEVMNYDMVAVSLLQMKTNYQKNMKKEFHALYALIIEAKNKKAHLEKDNYKSIFPNQEKRKLKTLNLTRQNFPFIQITLKSN